MQHCWSQVDTLWVNTLCYTVKNLDQLDVMGIFQGAIRPTWKKNGVNRGYKIFSLQMRKFEQDIQRSSDAQIGNNTYKETFLFGRVVGVRRVWGMLLARCKLWETNLAASHLRTDAEAKRSCRSVQIAHPTSCRDWSPPSKVYNPLSAPAATSSRPEVTAPPAAQHRHFSAFRIPTLKRSGCRNHLNVEQVLAGAAVSRKEWRPQTQAEGPALEGFLFQTREWTPKIFMPGKALSLWGLPQQTWLFSSWNAWESALCLNAMP